MFYKDTNQYTTAGSAPLLNSATFFLEFTSNTLINVPWNSEQLLFHFINKKNVYINICNVTSFITTNKYQKQKLEILPRSYDENTKQFCFAISTFICLVITKIMGILMIVLVYVKNMSCDCDGGHLGFLNNTKHRQPKKNKNKNP